MDGPPSFTAAIARNSDDHQHSQVTEPNHVEPQDQYNPTMSKMRSYSSFEKDPTIPHAIVLQPTETNDEYVQPLSMGDIAWNMGSEVMISGDTVYTSYEQAPSMGVIVGDRGDTSQPSGGDLSYNVPAPSYNDVAPRDASDVGHESHVPGGNLPEGDYEQMSFTKHDFARLYNPTMFQ
ncbi:hypothetical protein QVD17_37416 [Tagetes erecta]|uniref:Uncharacterized protein n=1 Tax=Tagetes erecta TaxID=13708 RepID=A0AAD8K0G8_TARER|nr:hypothetical protein QVD17_37416 [Tagetes erecta]